MPPEFVYLMLFVALAGTVQGTVGFGFGLVAMSTIPLWIDIKEAVPMVALLCLVVNLALAWRLWPHMSWRHLGPLVTGSLVGVPIGVYLFSTMDPNWLLVGLGIALLCITVQQVFFGKVERVSKPLSRGWGGVAGLLTGILGGAFNAGGPPAVIYVSVQTWSKEHTVATLQGFFLTTTLFQITLFMTQGSIGWIQVQSAGILVIPTLIGVAFGQFLFDRVNQQHFRSMLLTGIGILGTSLVYKGLAASLG